jgi:hypothetical protein
LPSSKALLGKIIDENGQKLTENHPKLRKVAKYAENRPEWVVKAIFERCPDSLVQNGLKN